MIRYIVKLLITVSLNLYFVHNEANAQCIDSLGINPTAPCSTDYTPVCGCGITYRNLCYARYRSGVIAQLNDGPCSGFEFDIFPTFVSQDDVPRITFVQNAGRVANFFILDSFGKVVMQRTLPVNDQLSTPFVFDIPEVVGFRPGTYIVIVYNSEGTYRFKKFVRIAL